MWAPSALLLLGLAAIPASARAESAISAPDGPVVSMVALSTYSQDEPSGGRAGLVAPDVLLGTIRTTSSSSISDHMGQRIEQDIRRTLRQRHPHAQFCADSTGLETASEEVVVQLRIDGEGTRTVRSAAHPLFAECLTHLVQHWPLPDLADDSKTRVAYRTAPPTNDP